MELQGNRRGLRGNPPVARGAGVSGAYRPGGRTGRPGRLSPTRPGQCHRTGMRASRIARGMAGHSPTARMPGGRGSLGQKRRTPTVAGSIGPRSRGIQRARESCPRGSVAGSGLRVAYVLLRPAPAGPASVSIAPSAGSASRAQPGPEPYLRSSGVGSSPSSRRKMRRAASMSASAPRRDHPFDLGLGEPGGDALGGISAGCFVFEHERHRQEQGRLSVQRLLDRRRRGPGGTPQRGNDDVGVENEAHLLRNDII